MTLHLVSMNCSVQYVYAVFLMQDQDVSAINLYIMFGKLFIIYSLHLLQLWKTENWFFVLVIKSDYSHALLMVSMTQTTNKGPTCKDTLEINLYIHFPCLV